MYDKDGKLQLTLLGPFSARLSDGSMAVFPTQKTQALLAIITLAGSVGIHRDTLADMLWSRSGEGQARANLRQALASLRKALGPDGGCIRSNGPMLSLDTARVTSDTASLSADPPGATGPAIEASLLESAELLTGMTLNEPVFEDWLTTQRAHHAELASAALMANAERHVEQGNYAAALRIARNLIARDAYHEAAYRLEMQVLHASGETAAAVKSYETLCRRLQTDLGIEPGTHTRAVFDSLRSATAAGPADVAMPPVAATRADKPTIAVLPFTSLSDDPEQRFFSDGITTDITTELSRIRFVSVTAIRNEALPKEGAPDLHEFAAAQGVDFILAGSVRRAGQRVRITVQLIEAGTGKLAWSERYDRDDDDIFDIQDEVTRSIASAIPGRLIDAVAARVTRAPPANMKAYEYVLQGKAIRDDFSAEATARARRLFEKAIEADPTYARAHSYLADTYFMDFMLGLSDDDTTSRFYELMQTAIHLDSRDAAIQEEMGFAYLAVGQ